MDRGAECGRAARLARFAIAAAICAAPLAPHDTAAATATLPDLDAADLFGAPDVAVTQVGSSTTSGAVSQFAVDAQGFVWFVSPDGFGRIHGFDVDMTHLSDPGNQLTGEAVSIAADPASGIWLAAGGLQHYDPWTRELTPFDIPVSRLAATETGLWIWHQNELSFFDFASRQISSTIELDEQSLDDATAKLVVSHDGAVYLASDKRVLIVSVSGEVVSRTIAGGVNEIASRAGGGIWISGSAGLWLQNGTGLARLAIAAPENAPLDNGLVEFGPQRVLIGTSGGGVLAFDPTAGTWVGHYRTRSSDAANVTNLFVGPTGDLWMSRLGLGITHVTRQGNSMRLYPYPETDSIFSFAAFSESTDGLVIASEEGSTWILDRESGDWRPLHTRAEQIANATERALVGMIHTDDSMWIALDRLQVIEVPADESRRVQPLFYVAVEDVVLHPDGDEIWSMVPADSAVVVGQLDGRLRGNLLLRAGEVSFNGIDFLDGLAYLATDDTIWIIDDERIEPVATLSAADGLPEIPFTAIHAESADEIFVGTASGLIKVNPLTGESELFQSDRGVPRAKIRAIVRHPRRDALWLATPTGLVLFDLTEGHATGPFGLRHGLLAPVLEDRSFERLDDDSLALASSSGLVIVEPDFPAGWIDNPVNAFAECVIGCGDFDGRMVRAVDRLTFRILVPSGVSASGLRIEYQLGGLEDEWQQATAGQLVSYRNLEAGSYQFRVRVRGPSGELSELSPREPGSRIGIRIAAPFLSRTDVRLAAAVSALVLVGGSVVIRSINARRRERQLERAVAVRTAEAHQARIEAEEAHEVKTRFLSTVTHELRAPLTSILGFAELATDASRQDRDRYIRNIGSAGDHLAQMIEDLIVVAQGEKSAVNAHIRESLVVVPDLLEELGNLVHPQIERAGMALNFDDRFARGAVVPLDKVAVRQILINLIGNAIQHSGGKRIDVTVTPQSLEVGRLTGLRFAVRDNGGSLPPNDIDTITARFRRGSDARGDGMGLGLSIANQLIIGAGSRLEVHVAPGRSTTFSFVLPASGTSPSVAIEVPKTDVWVVDDQRSSREVIGEMLRGFGLEVREFADGAGPLEAIASACPRIVFTDIMMVPIDGVELARRLRELAPHPIRIVAVTGVHEQLREQPVFDAVIGKPMRLRDLRKVVDDMVALT